MEPGSLVGPQPFDFDFQRHGVIDTSRMLRWIPDGEQPSVLGEEVVLFRNYLGFLIHNAHQEFKQVSGLENQASKKLKAKTWDTVFQEGEVIADACRGRNIPTIDALKTRLNEYGQDLSAQLAVAYENYENKDEEQIDALEKMSEAAERAIHRVSTTTTDEIQNHAQFQAWLQRRSETHPEERSPLPLSSSPQAPAASEPLPTLKEREILETELLRQVEENGSVLVHVSTPPLPGLSHSGFQDFSDDRWQGDKYASRSTTSYLGLSDRNLTSQYEKSQVREAVGVYLESVGSMPVTHSQLVKNGKDEPVSALMYGTRILSDDTVESGRSHPDESGRPGNMVRVTILLPDSLARKVFEAIKANPVFVRQVVETMVTKRTRLTSEHWNGTSSETPKPLRPPYEAWDNNGTNMYITDQEEYGFDPTRVFAVTKAKSIN